MHAKSLVKVFTMILVICMILTTIINFAVGSSTTLSYSATSTTNGGYSGTSSTGANPPRTDGYYVDRGTGSVHDYVFVPYTKAPPPTYTPTVPPPPTTPPKQNTPVPQNTYVAPSIIIPVPSTVNTPVRPSIIIPVPSTVNTPVPPSINVPVPSTVNTPGIVVPTPVRTPVPAGIDFEKIYLTIIDGKMDRIISLIHKEDKKWNLTSVSKVDVELDSGEIVVKVQFKYKNGWKTSKVNAYMYFDTLSDNNFTKYGLRFKKIDKIKASNVLLNLGDTIPEFEKKVNKVLSNKLYWYNDDPAQEYKVLVIPD